MPEEVKVTFGNIQDLKIKTQFDEKVGRVRWGFSFESNVDPALIAPPIHAQSEGIPLYAVIGSRQLRMVDTTTGEIK